MEIRLFDVDTASASELTGYHRLMVATAADWFSDAPTDYDSVIARARSRGSVFGPITRWAGYVEDVLVGFATASLPEDASTDVAVVRITVHPGYRDRGVGTALLRHLATECRVRGRTVLEAWHIPVGGVGERWARQRGFATVNTIVQQKLHLPEVDPSTWRVDAPAGYHAVSWIGAAPDDLVASYARASNAIHDAPFGESGFELPQWTVEKVRDAEARFAAQGVEFWVVAAVRDADGEVAGLTELMLRSWLPDTAIVNNTAVLQQHRGHGLGVFVKARMTAWLRARRPAYRWIATSTAASNEHMIRINERIGFRSWLRTVVVNADIADLRSGGTDTIH